MTFYLNSTSSVVTASKSDELKSDSSLVGNKPSTPSSAPSTSVAENKTINATFDAPKSTGAFVSADESTIANKTNGIATATPPAAATGNNKNKKSKKGKSAALATDTVIDQESIQTTPVIDERVAVVPTADVAVKG